MQQALAPLVDNAEMLAYQSFAARRHDKHTAPGILAALLGTRPFEHQNTRERLDRRETDMGAGTMAAEAIELLMRVAGEHGIRDLAVRIHHHEPTYSASAKQFHLPKGVLVQKTLSLKCGNAYQLATGVGPWHISRQIRRSFVARDVLPSSANNSFTINPASFDVASELLLAPGMVSPFLKPRLVSRLERVVILEPVDLDDAQFAVSLSLLESLVLPVRHFVGIVSDYLSAALPHLPLRIARLTPSLPPSPPLPQHASPATRPASA